jgi:DNA polymerase-4
VGEAAGRQLYELAQGRDPRRVTPEQVERSIGSERTFEVDVVDDVVLRRELLRLSEKVAARLRAVGQAGRTVSVKVRFADFTTVTRSRTLPYPTDVAREVYDTVAALYTALGLDRARIRLVGVRVEGLAAAGQAPHQLTFGERDRGWREAEQAVDAAVRRFGSGAIRPAALVGNPTDDADTAVDGEGDDPLGDVPPADRRDFPAPGRGGRVSRGRTDR